MHVVSTPSHLKVAERIENLHPSTFKLNPKPVLTLDAELGDYIIQQRQNKSYHCEITEHN